MLNVPLREGSVAFTLSGVQQFTRAEVLKWLSVEEENALEIVRDADDRGLAYDADLALIRVEALAKLRSKIRWSGFANWLTRKSQKAIDLDKELGDFQQALGGNNERPPG